MNRKQLQSILQKTRFSIKVENTLQYVYEKELEARIAKIFRHMRKRILENLEEYYSPDIMFNIHADLILSPIHEYHREYYDTIMKYKNREYGKGKTQARRLVKMAKKYAMMNGSIKADTNKLKINDFIEKDELFATSEYSAEHMRDKTFVASENTLSRVDDDIKGIISDGYEAGNGINDVSNRINTRFDQLESWEARRIARTEIHGSHMQGVMQTYTDMGVEYTQWAAAQDLRTRNSHLEIDGEIIPMGGVYSNGLAYPGDTSGPIEEWINCRCGNIPWFCPPGMMVPPGMTHFRESDLISLSANSENMQLSNWEITDAEKKLKSDLTAKRHNGGLSDSEKKQLRLLRDKEKFNILQNKLTEDEYLDYGTSKQYVKLYKKYESTWKMPEVDKTHLEGISSNRKEAYEYAYGYVEEYSEKYALSTIEEQEFNSLLSKRLWNDGELSPKDASKLKELYSQKQFNYLYTLNKQDKGLEYKAYKIYANLYNLLKTKLKLKKDILEIPLSNYDSKIKLDASSKNFKIFEGTTDDGLLPGGEDIDEWFTIDTRNLTPRERAVVEKWQGSDYRYFTDYVVTCNRDVDKFAKFAYESSKSKMYSRIITKEKARWVAEEIAYDTLILDRVLGNQLKKSVTLWRVQEDHFMGDNPKVGDIITLPDFRSTAISKEGALWFNDSNSKSMNYILEIEAPKGTYGAYIAPLKEGDDFVKEMEFLLKEAKLEIMEFDDYRMQTASGNELIHIKIRIIE